VFGGAVTIAVRASELVDQRGWVIYGSVMETATRTRVELRGIAVGEQVEVGKKRRYLVTVLCVSPYCPDYSAAAQFEVSRL
jgi:hypothetical protein